MFTGFVERVTSTMTTRTPERAVRFHQQSLWCLADGDLGSTVSLRGATGTKVRGRSTEHDIQLRRYIATEGATS